MIQTENLSICSSPTAHRAYGALCRRDLDRSMSLANWTLASWPGSHDVCMTSINFIHIYVNILQPPLLVRTQTSHALLKFLSLLKHCLAFHINLHAHPLSDWWQGHHAERKLRVDCPTLQDSRARAPTTS